MALSAPADVPRSTANALSFALGTLASTCFMAESTRDWVLPFTMTVAPSRASPSAMANPIPAVDPVTSAVLPSSCRSMPSSMLGTHRRIQRSSHHIPRLETSCSRILRNSHSKLRKLYPRCAPLKCCAYPGVWAIQPRPHRALRRVCPYTARDLDSASNPGLHLVAHFFLDPQRDSSRASRP